MHKAKRCSLVKILLVSTISNFINDFLIPHIKMLIENGYQVDVACNLDRPIKEEVFLTGCKVHTIDFQRTPFNRRNLAAYKQLKKLIEDESYDLVHAHTPVSSALTRVACKRMKDVKVIYTAHGFYFYKGAGFVNWCLYYPIEKWLSKYTDALITINHEDYAKAKKSLFTKKIEYTSGVGFDFMKFKNIDVDKNKKLKSLSLPTDCFIILSVGELNKNKNHEVVIRAIDKMNHSKIHYLICGEGNLREKLHDLAVDLGLEKQVHLLGFREDVHELCKISQLFVFPSKREGLGLAALEAMAAGLPTITSNVHGIVDYSVNGETGYLCSPNDVDGFSDAIKKLLEDKEKREAMGVNNIERVKKFDISNVLKQLEEIYTSILLAD